MSEGAARLGPNGNLAIRQSGNRAPDSDRQLGNWAIWQFGNQVPCSL